MPQQILIHLGQNKNLTLRFNMRTSPLAALWSERMQLRHSWPLDHPDRFYGFGTAAQEYDRAVNLIQQCIATINDHKKIIHRSFEYTQDCLNYLHSIFEHHHGLLDQQISEYWQSAPESARKALAELNVAVHRCESVAAGLAPRFVCTWYGMPKTQCLNSKLQRTYGTSKIQFGTMYLNYCEIGKTVEDLAHDNDNYISDAAFKPFDHYSADFNVAFFDQDIEKNYPQVQQYIDTHQEFFVAKGISSVYNIQAQPLRFPIADLIYTGSRQQLLSQISQHQHVKEVELE